MLKEGQIVTPDGTRVAYRVLGDPDASAPSFVLTNGLTTSTRCWDHLAPVWARDRRVLLWDLPGHGRSTPAGSDTSATILGQPAILMQLMDAAGIERAVQVGYSTGSQVVFELYRAAPERCVALVSLLGTAGRVLSTARLPLPGGAIDWIAQHTPRRVFDTAAAAMARGANTRAGHLLGRRLGLIGAEAEEPDVRRLTEHLGQMDPATVQRMVHSAEVQSAHDLLPHVELPVLLVAGDRDPFAPSEQVGVPMHAALPDSELVRLPECTHTGTLDHAREIAATVSAFVERRLAG